MLLTLYYMINSISRSWKIKSIKNTLTDLASQNYSVVVYKEKNLSDLDYNVNYDLLRSFLRGITSEYCINSESAILHGLWYSKSDKRGCSIQPQQIVDISCWLAINVDDHHFPISFSNVENPPISKPTYLLIEAEFTSLDESTLKTCSIENYGIPVSWTADQYFGIIIQTDIDHFSSLCSEFINSKLYIGNSMHVVRLQTVTVEGSPCQLLDIDKIPHLNIPFEKAKKQENDLSEDQSERNNFDCSGESFRITMLKKIAEATSRLISSGKNLIDLDYPPVSVMRSAFVTSVNTASKCEESDFVEESLQCTSIDDVNNMEYQKLELVSEPIIVNGGHNTPNSPNNTPVHKNSIINTNGDSVINSPAIPVRQNSNSTYASETSSVASPSYNRLKKTNSTYSSASTSAGDCNHTGKPPNIIVFGESSSCVENMRTSLNKVLREYRYTVYNLSTEDMLHSPWVQQASLLVICGNVPLSLRPRLLNYLLNSKGKVLCSCSDFLGQFLPTFQTAEVRPDEVVSFSYGRWPHISLLHHVFCYQPSPSNTKFALDEPPPLLQNHQDHQTAPAAAASTTQTMVEVIDAAYQLHTLNVQILAAEKTWQTPILLAVTEGRNGGKVLFSQVHLEMDPPNVKLMENTMTTMKNGNEEENTRLLLLSELLSEYLGLECDMSERNVHYEPAYFLGDHNRKGEFLKTMMERIKAENELSMKNITLRFYESDVKYLEASPTQLPVRIHECPQNFSTYDYFKNLQTKYLGRLVIYAEVMTSSLEILNGPTLEHGLVAVSRQQTSGIGRSKNAWISPYGCAMFSIQLHIKLESKLGQRLALLQHIIALSVVSGIRSQSGLESLPIGLKWPNDIYANGSVKIGGLIITSNIVGNMAICNAGCGVNLSNSYPTTCINDMIDEMGLSVEQHISLEKYLAVVFNELERLLNCVNEFGTDEIYELYYKYWLHDSAQVSITKSDGSSQSVVVAGLDDYGFLRVRGLNGEVFSVQPDGNTFDMLSGLIAPK